MSLRALLLRRLLPRGRRRRRRRTGPVRIWLLLLLLLLLLLPSQFMLLMITPPHAFRRSQHAKALIQPVAVVLKEIDVVCCFIGARMGSRSIGGRHASCMQVALGLGTAMMLSSATPRIEGVIVIAVVLLSAVATLRDAAGSLPHKWC